MPTIILALRKKNPKSIDQEQLNIHIVQFILEILKNIARQILLLPASGFKVYSLSLSILQILSSEKITYLLEIPLVLSARDRI